MPVIRLEMRRTMTFVVVVEISSSSSSSSSSFVNHCYYVVVVGSTSTLDHSRLPSSLFLIASTWTILLAKE